MNDEKDYSKALIGIICLAVALLAALAFSGCTTDLKVMHRIEKINIKHSAAVASATRKLYPCITTHEKIDTTFVKGDSVLVEVPCPDFTPRTIHNTIHHPSIIRVPIKIPSSKEVIHDVKYVADDAALFVLRDSCQKLTSQNVAKQSKIDDLKIEKKWWEAHCIITWVILALAGIIALLIKFKPSLPI